MVKVCWFHGRDDRPCEGRLVKAHLIAKQTLKREVGKSRAIVWHPAVWVWACGGITGLGGHHGRFDARQLTLQRGDLPPALEHFADDWNLSWWLTRTYGEA